MRIQLPHSVFTNKGTGGNGKIRISNSGYLAATTNDFCNAAGTGLGTVEFYGASAALPPLTIYPNLLISGSSYRSLNSASMLVLGNFNITGTTSGLSLGNTAINISILGNTIIDAGNFLDFGTTTAKNFTNSGDFLCSGGCEFIGRIKPCA